MVEETILNDPNISQTIDNINSLILLSATIRVFSIRWQLIRKRLEELSSGLTAMESTLFSSHDFVIVELVALVYCVVDECHGLASRCISVSYCGKLLMQSDLDKVVSRLDLVLDKFLDICHMGGVVSSGLALVVSRPPVGATRDDIRFYLNDLLNRLKIGDCQMKTRALISLKDAIITDEKYVKNVMEIDEVVMMLASCLDSSNSSIQEAASAIVSVILEYDCYKGMLVMSGVIAPLIRALENGTIKTKENAIRCLMRLTMNGDNAWAFSAHGGVTILLSLCSNGDEKPELIGLACWVLRNVIVVDEIKKFMIEDGAILIFLKLVESSNEMCQIGSVEFLQLLASDDESTRHLVVNEGGARGLVRVLDPKLNVSFKVRETVLRAIENMCFCSDDCVNLLIGYGFIDELLYFLRYGDDSIQELALKSASRLCKMSEEARKSMGDLGFLSEFVKFLEAKSYDIREMAAEALSNLIMIPKNRKKFSMDDHNIGIVLQWIDPKDGNSGNSKYLLSILLSISNCKHARKIISHSGYVEKLEKLAEIGVTDAKKITRKLSRNRFKNIILKVILHS